MIYLHCLQNVKERDSETVSSSGKGRRKSIKECNFAETHAELLKRIYKFYQAMHFAYTSFSGLGTHLIVEAAFRCSSTPHIWNLALHDIIYDIISC